MKPRRRHRATHRIGKRCRSNAANMRSKSPGERGGGGGEERAMRGGGGEGGREEKESETGMCISRCRGAGG